MLHAQLLTLENQKGRSLRIGRLDDAPAELTDVYESKLRRFHLQSRMRSGQSNSLGAERGQKSEDKKEETTGTTNQGAILGLGMLELEHEHDG